MLDTTPLTRDLPGEWGSTVARMRADSSVRFMHQICPKPRNSRCSGVKPSIFFGDRRRPFFRPDGPSAPCRPGAAAVVGRVLAQRQLAVELDVVDGGEVRILLHEAIGALFECFGVASASTSRADCPWRRTGGPRRRNRGSAHVRSPRRSRRSSRRRPSCCRRTAAAGCRPGN